MLHIHFWQRIVTPHMAHLAVALSRRGHDVTYTAEREMSGERADMGWQAPELDGVTLNYARDSDAAQTLVQQTRPDAVHLTQGLRSNGVVKAAQAEIRRRGQRHLAILETVDCRGLSGRLKPVLYRWHLWRWRRGLEGILAIGADTPKWLGRRPSAGLPVHPFAYFLPDPGISRDVSATSGVFRFVFAGALISRKRVDLLIEAVGSLKRGSFDLVIVGDGPLRSALEFMANELLPGRVRFLGTLPIGDVPGVMAASDCLVLPSDHDGWGAVVSEALMCGTPVICSSACGARGVVDASGKGGVFEVGDAEALRRSLAAALDEGVVTVEGRVALREWAHCLGAGAGAAWLEEILLARASGHRADTPPWEKR